MLGAEYMIKKGVWPEDGKGVYADEIHNLPSTKTTTDCWLSIKHYLCDIKLTKPIIQYHYTSLKEGNKGCYMTEYVHDKYN